MRRICSSVAKRLHQMQEPWAGDSTPKWFRGRERLRASFEQLHKRGEALTEQLWNGLREIDGVRLYGPAAGRPRTPTVAFTIDKVPSIEVVKHLAEHGLFLSHGDFYAMTVVERLGQSRHGLVRVGCACYTTSEEVERLVNVVSKLGLT